MSLPPEIIVFFTGMTPFLEIKLAIPLGIQLGLSGSTAFLFATAGTIVPAAITLATIEPVTNFLRRHSKLMDKFFSKTFEKTRKKHTKGFERYGAILLFTLVAIPLPGSGSMTGAVVSFLFGVDPWKTLGLVCLGTITSGLIITAGFGSIMAFASLF